jgi:predicted Zn-dependent protease
MGKQSAQEVQRSIGYYNDPAVQQYVSSIGLKMAKVSERPNLPWEFHVVNDASVNAFALPGGFIFVTRGLMTSINDAAELATVVGHEIGHVTNRHSVQQISKAEVAQLGLGVGAFPLAKRGERGWCGQPGSQSCSSTAATRRTRRIRRGSATRSTRTMTCARWRTCSRRWSG